MKIKGRKGISLIVLVITIIVMIILAAAIILSLSNSGIIGKANKAKTDSDTANLKEYVNTLRAEWELMTDAERTESGAKTFEEYANKKLNESGYGNVAVSPVDGEVYANLSENAKKVIMAGIKVGDVVTGYTVTEKSYNTSGEENTADLDENVDKGPQSNTITTNTNVTWKYLGISSNGKIEMIAMLGKDELSLDKRLMLSGKGGYLKGPEVLNTVCKELYSKNGVGTARSMNIDDVIKLLGYTGNKGKYINNNGDEIETAGELTVAEILKSNGVSGLTNKITPDGKDIMQYKSNCYSIGETVDKDKITNLNNVALIYGDMTSYWVASNCAMLDLVNNNVEYSVRYVDPDIKYVSRLFIFDSSNYFNGFPYAVRPVVELESNVSVSYDNTTHILSLN